MTFFKVGSKHSRLIIVLKPLIDRIFIYCFSIAMLASADEYLKDMISVGTVAFDLAWVKTVLEILEDLFQDVNTFVFGQVVQIYVFVNGFDGGVILSTQHDLVSYLVWLSAYLFVFLIEDW